MAGKIQVSSIQLKKIGSIVRDWFSQKKTDENQPPDENTPEQGNEQQ